MSNILNKPLILSLLILSFGQGSAFSTMYAAASTGVAAEHQGIGSGMASTGQQIGNAVGLAILVAIANRGTAGLTGESLRTATTHGLRLAVLLTAAGVVVTAAIALTGRRRTPVLIDAISN